MISSLITNKGGMMKTNKQSVTNKQRIIDKYKAKPGSRISLMGEIFSKDEIRKISIMWMVVPEKYRVKYKRTYGRFSKIVDMIDQLSQEIDNHPDNRK
jgi:hypothetical protein